MRQRPVREVADRILTYLFLEIDCRDIDIRLVCADPALLAHQAEHDTRTGNCSIHVGGRGISARRLDETCDDRRFTYGKFICGVAEKFATGRIHAVCAAAEIDLVEIKLENLFLGELPFQRHRQHGFAHFAVNCAIGVEEYITRQLLRNRRGRTKPVFARRPDIDGAGQAIGVDARMRIEAPVLDRNHRVLHDLGDFVRSQPFSVAGTKLDNLGSVTRAHYNGLRVLRGFQLVETRQ